MAVYLLFIIFASLTYMSIGSGIVVAVALQKVDRAPHAKAGAQRHNEGLQNTDRTVEKCHNFVLLKVGGRSNPPRPEMVVLVTENTGFPRLYTAFPDPARRMDACHCQSGDSSIPGRPEGERPYAAAVRWPGSGSGEQAGQQGDQGDADEGDTAARHQLLHALALGPGVVVAVALQKVDRAPHAETGAQRHNEGLQNTDSTVEKCHKFVLLQDSGRSLCPARFVE